MKHWKSVIMLTLTVDPKLFDSPWDALEAVGKKRGISELTKALHRKGQIRSREFTCTLEFHKSGWPHWHVLVDSNFVDKHVMQSIWKRGNTWVSKHDFATVEHAINYATKYIVKTEEDREAFTMPGWVLDYKGNIRRFSTSRGLCPTRKHKKKKDDGEVKRVRVRKTGRQRTEQ